MRPYHSGDEKRSELPPISKEYTSCKPFSIGLGFGGSLIECSDELSALDLTGVEIGGGFQKGGDCSIEIDTLTSVSIDSLKTLEIITESNFEKMPLSKQIEYIEKAQLTVERLKKDLKEAEESKEYQGRWEVKNMKWGLKMYAVGLAVGFLFAGYHHLTELKSGHSREANPLGFLVSTGFQIPGFIYASIAGTKMFFTTDQVEKIQIYLDQISEFLETVKENKKLKIQLQEEPK